MISIIDSPAACLEIGRTWNQLVLQQSSLPSGLGPICQLELTLLAKEVLATRTDLKVVVLEDGKGGMAILPCFRERQRQAFLSWSKLGCVPNLYPGRVGIIHDKADILIANSLASAILSDSSDWDIFAISVVSNGVTETSILKAADDQSLTCRLVAETDIPFITFPSTWDEYLSSLAKKFRYTIRSGEKELRKLGKLEMRSFTRPEQCDEFLRLSYAIERKSWKEDAGTSLTRQPTQKTFHEQLAPVAAGLGMFHGYVLLLNDEPIAHIYGVKSGDVFCDLKESFDARYADYSPGSVLKALVMQELIGGIVKHWDFIGRAEFHKLRWTDQTYSLRQYLIYTGAKGRLLQWRHDLGTLMRRLGILSAEEDAFGRPVSTRRGRPS